MKKIIPKDAVLIPEEAACVFKGIIYDVYQWQQTLHNGKKSTFEMLKRPDTAEVIGVVGKDLIVIDDNQPHSGSRSSFPGGRVDQHDGSTLIAAQREVLEETGYKFNQWRLIAVKQPFTKIEWFLYFWLASGAEKVSRPTLDAGEEITVSLLEFDVAREMSLNDVGYLGESRKLFEVCGSLDELLAFPEFKGQEVDR